MKKINVIYVKVGESPVRIEIEDNLETLQKLVGGYIEATYPFEEEAVLICNEEGKLNGLSPNRVLVDSDYNILDIIVGDFIIAYAPCDSDKFESLPNDLSEKYLKTFSSLYARV